MGVGIAAAAIVGGSALKAYGSHHAGSAQQDIANSNAQLMMMQAKQQQAMLNAQAQMMTYNARIAEVNAGISANNAAQARKEAKFEADRIKEKNTRLRGRQKALYAASGVQLEGTPNAVIFDSDLQGELEALVAIYQGDITAGKHDQQRFNDLSRAQDHLANARASQMQGRFGLNTASAQADILYQQGANAASAGNINAASSLLDGVGSLLQIT